MSCRYAVSLPLPAVAAFLVEPDGYFIASVQETLREIFAGPEAAAQLPSCAKTFRLAPVLQLEPNPNPDTAPEPERGDGNSPARRSPAGRRRGARGGARYHGRVRRRPQLGCSVHLCGLSWRGWPSRPCSTDRPVALVARWPWLGVCCSDFCLCLLGVLGGLLACPRSALAACGASFPP